MKYRIEQFPKNKDIDPGKLSEAQVAVRRNSHRYTYASTIACKKCGKEQAPIEFWMKNKETGRRDSTCRDCRMRAAGVIEVGKQRFATKIFRKGFRRCSICKTIKPLAQYSRLRSHFGGINHTCKSCSFLKHKDFQDRNRSKISEWYLRQIAKERGVQDPSASVIDGIRAEVMQRRALKYFTDGHGFATKAEFARYIQKTYGILVATTEKRLAEGATLEQCKLSETQMRSAAHTIGAIRVVDTVNGKVFVFKNTNDPRLLKMFGGSTVTSCIRSGKPTRITSLSKYKNPCTIQRVK